MGFAPFPLPPNRQTFDAVDRPILERQEQQQKTMFFSWIIIFSIIVGALVFGTYIRNRAWKSEISLWTDNVKKSPAKFRPRNNLAIALSHAGRPEEAAQQFAAAIENPRKEDRSDIKRAIKEIKVRMAATRDKDGKKVPTIVEVDVRPEDLFGH